MSQVKDIDCVILCGGLGKRLRSVHSSSPKVLVDVHDQPFLDILITYLKSQDIQRVILCTGYKSEIVEDYYKEHNHGLTIEFSKEEEPLGTGGAIKNAQSLVQSDPFFVLNGDVYCEFDYAALLKDYEQKGATATLAVAQLDQNKDFGSMTLDEDNKILGFMEKQATNATCNVSVGIYCFSREVFNLMPAEKSFSIEYDVFPKLVDGKFYGHVTDKEFIDIGTPERYEQAKEMLKRRG